MRPWYDVRAEEGGSETNKETKGRKGGQQFFLHCATADHFPARKKVDRRERKDDEDETYKLVHPAVVAAC